MKWIAIGATLLFLAGAGLSLRTPASAESAEVIQSREREILMLRAEVRLLHHRLAERKRMEDALSQVRAQLDELRSMPVTLQRQIEGRERAITKTREEFAGYRELSRSVVRRRGAGETFANLRLPDGRTFEEVTVTEITDVGMTIKHTDGSARIVHSDLPLPLQEKFMWREEEANKALAREAGQKRQLAKAIAEAKESERKRLVRAAEEREERLAVRNTSAALSAIYTSSNGLRSSGRLGERRPVGNGYSRRGYRSSWSRRSNTTIYYYRSPRTTTPRINFAPRVVAPPRTRSGFQFRTLPAVRPGC